MKGFHTVALAPILVCALAGAAQAQDAPATGRIVRADVHGTLGWFNADNREEFDVYENWTDTFFGGATVGWYWTDHLKTEIEVGATSAREFYSSERLVVGGQTTFVPSRYRINTRRLALTQQYQFGDNAWFHPYVAAGVDFSSDRIREESEPAFIFDQQTRTPRQVTQHVTHPERTERITRPSIATGFKAYMSTRAFFRSDLRLAFRDGVDEVLMRIGMGVDF